jgi:hypothetical protein
MKLRCGLIISRDGYKCKPIFDPNQIFSNMFMFKKSTRSILPLAQEIEEKDGDSEQTAMLDHEYLESKSRSRSWHLWRSNVPWILTTVALLLYTFVFTPSDKRNKTPWSPTDVGKFVSITRGKTYG